MVLDRREFIRNSTLAGLGVALLPNLSYGSPLKKTLNVGFIGMGLRRGRT